MNTLLKCLLILTITVPNLAVAKPCGNGYIRDDYECHQGGGGSDGPSSTQVLGVVLGLALVTGAIVYFAGSEKRHAVRDTVAYQVELDQYDAWATKQAALLKGFVGSRCTCDDAERFTTPECSQSADFILTIESRAAWHKNMSLFLAGISDTRPAADPPAIPDNSTLCPERTNP